MSITLNSLTCPLWKQKKPVSFFKPSLPTQAHLRRDCRVKAFFFNPTEDPVLKEALKEPVAFMGGMFAGLLRLDLNEDPLREWVTRTVEASGITPEELERLKLNPEEEEEEEVPQQIEIE